MILNPFEDKQNQYDLKEILEKTDEFWTEYKVKKEYEALFGEYLDYDVLVKAIDLNIDWHILTTGSYQGDFWYIGLKDNKIYFLNIGYGSCSGCDALLAREDDIQGLISLQDSIKRDIREFDSFEELINWIVNGHEWWFSETNEILDFIRNEFDLDFEIVRKVQFKDTKGEL